MRPRTGLIQDETFLDPRPRRELTSREVACTLAWIPGMLFGDGTPGTKWFLWWCNNAGQFPASADFLAFCTRAAKTPGAPVISLVYAASALNSATQNAAVSKAVLGHFRHHADKYLEMHLKELQAFNETAGDKLQELAELTIKGGSHDT